MKLNTKKLSSLKHIILLQDYNGLLTKMEYNYKERPVRRAIVRKLYLVPILLIIISGCVNPASPQSSLQNKGDWQRSYEGASGWRIGYSVSETGDGGFVVAGKQIGLSSEKTTENIFLTD
ncbi:MAG: hypothetical protein ACM3PP_08405, partial [Candidatus Saccharibacteria bacterium]